MGVELFYWSFGYTIACMLFLHRLSTFVKFVLELFGRWSLIQTRQRFRLFHLAWVPLCYQRLRLNILADKRVEAIPLTHISFFDFSIAFVDFSHSSSLCNDLFGVWWVDICIFAVAPGVHYVFDFAEGMDRQRTHILLHKNPKFNLIQLNFLFFFL